MFGQHSITIPQTSANIDHLKSSKPQSSTSDTQSFVLFPPSSASTGGRLFLSTNDFPQNKNPSSLPPRAINLERSASLTATNATTTTTNASPNVLIPTEGRITKGSVDNALPIFFAGARQPAEQHQHSSSNNQELESSAQANSLTAQIEAGLSMELINTDSALKDDTTETEPSSIVDDEIRTIKVFGFPPNLVDTLRKHFEKYGRIDSSQHSPGSWLSILYASPSSATAALKSNRMVIADTFMVGVILATTNLKPIPSKSVLNRTPTDHKHRQRQDHVYKSVLPLSDSVFADRSSSSNKKTATTTVGTGQAGVSVVGGPTVTSFSRTTIPQTTGWMGFFKDILFS